MRTTALLTSIVFSTLVCLGSEPAPAAVNSKVQAPSTIYDIRDFGAVGDGVIVNTKAFQNAIDKCTGTGGVVLVAGGRFVTGTIFLKSNVCLRIEAGAVMLGSPHIADYSTNTDRTMYSEPYMNRCLIFARDAENISFEGNGVIDGQGKSLPEKDDPDKNRPKMIRFIGCSHIRLRDLTLKNPSSWTSEWRACTDIAVDGISIASRNISNGDGLDFDGCTKVRVSNSTFECGDDCICLQTSDKAHPCIDFTINNCNFSGRWAGIRIGLLSRANFENVVVSNCTFHDHNDSGLKIQMMEGAVMSNMLFTNLVTFENLKRRWPEVGGLRTSVPAYGIYLRHVKGVTLQDVAISTVKTDARPAIVLVDVNEVKISETPSPVSQ